MECDVLYMYQGIKTSEEEKVPGCLVHCELREEKSTSGGREDQTCSEL